MNNFDSVNYYKTNLIIWLVILIGMSMLIGVTYFIDQNNVFQPVVESAEYKNIFFILILISALAVLFLKRTFLDFNNIYSKIESLNNADKKPAYFAKLRSNYIIIWAISESIIMFGFVEYILMCDYQSFLLYGVIGLYAIAINFPKKLIFETHLELLNNKTGDS